MFPARHISAIVTALLMPVALGMFTGCALSLRAPDPPSQADSVIARNRLARALTAYWQGTLPYRPDLAISLGFGINALPPHGEASARNATRLSMQLGPLLETVDAEALTPREYVVLQSMQWETETAAAAYAFSDLDLSLLSPRSSALRMVIDALRRHPRQTAADVERYLSLLDDAAFWISGIREIIEDKQAHGVVASVDAVLAFTNSLREVRDLTRAGALLTPEERVTTSDSIWSDSVRARERETQNDHMVVAMDSLLSWLETSYTATAMPRPGVWQYPGGKEYYRHLLRRNSGLDVTPEDAHEVGLSELTRLDSLLAIMRRSAGWNPSVIALHDSLRRIPRLATGSVDSAMAWARARQVQLADTLESAVRGLPSTRPTLRTATPLEQWLYPDGSVFPPPLSDSAVTVVATQAWAEADALIEIAGVSHRWLWPGAGLATAVGFTTDEALGFVLLHPSPGTQDGWSEYAASLAGELGTYQAPIDAYGRLLHEALNAAFLVVDTGIHYFGWTRQQGLALLRRYSLASDAHLSALLADRVIATPGAAGAATLGAREFAAMRAWMQRELGSDFSPPAWHAELLSLGPAPLPVLGMHLEWWAWSERNRIAEAAARDTASVR